MAITAGAFDVDFRRAWGEPLVRGELRRRPEDFFVSEELGFDPTGHGEHVFLRVRKTGANSGWVATRLAELAGIRPLDVSWSGRKDRHAVTEQWFSVWLPGREAPDWSSLELEGVTVLESRRHDRKLRRGTHRANRFRVRLRDMVRRDGIGAQDVDSRLADIRERGFPNYFGEQRFGRGGDNLARADELLTGARKHDGKRDLYLSAARAWLFNLELDARLPGGAWREPDAFGWLPGRHRRETCTYRVPGFETWYEGLERLGMKAMRRPLAVMPQDFDWQFEQGDLELAFSLPSGSYATALLREIADYRVARTFEEASSG